jgi:hypothetical protein
MNLFSTPILISIFTLQRWFWWLQICPRWLSVASLINILCLDLLVIFSKKLLKSNLWFFTFCLSRPSPPKHLHLGIPGAPCPLMPLVLLAFLLSGSFLVTTPRDRLDTWGSPMIIFFLLALLVEHSQTKTFLSTSPNVSIGTCCLSIFISWNPNQPSSTADCICQWNILQLVLWRKEPWHLQYTHFFNSSIGGIVCDNLMLPFLSSSSNILSHLSTLNVNLTFPFCVECRGERAADLALAGQTSSAACITFGFAGSKRHSPSCAGDYMLRLWCAASGVKHEDCVWRAVLSSTYAHPESPILVIGRSTEGPGGLVLYPDRPVVQCFSCDTCGRLGATPDCLA